MKTMINNDSQLRVLVSAIGTINGTAIIRELRRMGSNVYIYGTDIYPKEWVVNSSDVDEFYQVNPVLPNVNQYVDNLFSFCKKHLINAVFCVIDEEVMALAERRDVFSSIGTSICVADINSIKICHNKDLFFSWLSENLPNQYIRTYCNAQEINHFPVFIKPTHGRASAGCHKILSPQELTNIDWENNIVQDYVEGEIFAADIISNPAFNQIQVIQRKELLRNANGCGIVVEIVNDERINSICIELATKLVVCGVINVEFFVKNDDIKIIEVNPRLPAGTEFTCMAGGNSVINALKIALNEPCKFNDIKYGAILARRYETYKMC